MKSFLPFFYFLLLLCSCNRPCYQYDVYGADEFVIDSYKIRQGKLAILDMEGIEMDELSCDELQEYKDVIAEDDVLNVIIYHPKRTDLIQAVHTISQTIGFHVTEGKINLPDIPSIEVAGLTLNEAKQAIEACYRDHIRDVEVFLKYDERLSKKVELIGAVAHAFIPVDGKIRLFEVLAQARVSSVTANLFKSYIVRNGKQLSVDLYKLINEGDMTQNIVMHGEDRIFIAALHDATVMVMGEVNRPQAISVPYGFMSLREVLVSAGGVNAFSGDLDCIQVIRGNLQDPKIYVLSWNHVIHLPNDSLLLIPGDTVYVSERPVSQWNRFISQLLPTVEAFKKGHESYVLIRD